MENENNPIKEPDITSVEKFENTPNDDTRHDEQSASADEQSPVRPAEPVKDEGKMPRKPWWRRPWAIVASVALAVFVALAAWCAPLVLTGADDDATVYIRKGMTRTELSGELRARLGDDMGARVDHVLSIAGIDLDKRHGAFKVSKGESPLTIARRLRGGAPSAVRFTFNNVRTKEQFAARVGKTLMTDSASMMRVLTDSTLCAKYGKNVYNVVDLLLPDSYEFYWDIEPEQLLAKLATYYDKFWTAERRSRAESMGLTPEAVSIIASIVEEETAKRDERPMVARLYMNRLKQGMPLQADPTVKFAIGDFSIKRLYGDMLKTPSPYNTYYNKGLPPGPIRLAEAATLDAVLNAPEHNYIYMCAKEDFSGYHNFASDYATHQANARRYQQELNNRGIR